MDDISLDAQIECVQRELMNRIMTYPYRVDKGGMKEGEAKHELRAMRAVLITLCEVRLRRTELREEEVT